MPILQVMYVFNHLIPNRNMFPVTRILLERLSQLFKKLINLVFNIWVFNIYIRLLGLTFIGHKAIMLTEIGELEKARIPHEFISLLGLNVTAVPFKGLHLI